MNDCTEFGLDHVTNREPVHDDKTPGILRYFRPDIKMIISFFYKTVHWSSLPDLLCVVLNPLNQPSSCGHIHSTEDGNISPPPLPSL